MTTEQIIMSLPEGTKVRIKDDVECHEMYKEWGKLTFGQLDEDCDDHENLYGIVANGCVCYEFEAHEYVIAE